jgi:hypothetical protein
MGLPNYKIGDVVAIIGEHDFPLKPIINKVGVIKAINARAGVEFQEEIGGHNLDGQISNHRGWWVPFASLKKLEPLKNIIKSMYSSKE